MLKIKKILLATVTSEAQSYAGRRHTHTHTLQKPKASLANEHAESYPLVSLLFTSASIFRTHQKLLLLLVSC